jgi:hypothetical protein
MSQKKVSRSKYSIEQRLTTNISTEECPATDLGSFKKCCKNFTVGELFSQGKNPRTHKKKILKSSLKTPYPIHRPMIRVPVLNFPLDDE